MVSSVPFEEELVRLCAEHGKFVHKMDMTTMPPDFEAKFKSEIKTVTVRV